MKRLGYLTLLAVIVLAASMTVGGTAFADCPTGTNLSDILVCNGLSPNPDDVYGLLGGDRITVGNGAIVGFLEGNEGNDTILIRVAGQVTGGVWGDLVNPGNPNGNDVITNNGQVLGNIHGDGNPDPGTIGGKDRITNNGFANGIIGDIAETGGIDIIINNGQTIFINGDGVSGNGAADTITNNGTAESICGDGADGNGGADTITNNGEAGYISGDCVGINGGNDTIINYGFATFIEGDNASNTGGNDTIINYGEIDLGLCGDSTTGNGGNDVIRNYGSIYGAISGDCVAGFAGDDWIYNYGYADSINSESSFSEDGWDYVLNVGSVGPGGIYTGGGDDIVGLAAGSTVGGSVDGGTGFEVNGDTLQGMTLNAALYGPTTLVLSIDCTVVACSNNFNYKGQTYNVFNFETIEIWK